MKLIQNGIIQSIKNGNLFYSAPLEQQTRFLYQDIVPIQNSNWTEKNLPTFLRYAKNLGIVKQKEDEKKDYPNKVTVTIPEECFFKGSNYLVTNLFNCVSDLADRMNFEDKDVKTFNIKLEDNATHHLVWGFLARYCFKFSEFFNPSDYSFNNDSFMCFANEVLKSKGYNVLKAEFEKGGSLSVSLKKNFVNA